MIHSQDSFILHPARFQLCFHCVAWICQYFILIVSCDMSRMMQMTLTQIEGDPSSYKGIQKGG